VDDAPDDAEALSDLLAPMGMDIVPANSAEQALAILENDKVDLVVADLGLPGANGIELTRALRTRNDRMPIVLVTGSESVVHVVDALKAGANDYLQKPVHPDRLTALIDELLKESKKSGEEALQNIDRILEIARQMQQQSKSSGQGQPQQQQGDGKDPLEGQGQTTQQREQTPSSPEKQDKQEGKKPEPQNGKEKPDKPGPKPDGQSNPKDPKASKQSPQNQQSGPPPGTQTDKPGQGSDARDRWGDLPQRARDVFRSEGGHDMPVQYRDWIDAYYRRLNQKQP